MKNKKASRKQAVTQPKTETRHELLQWLESMPESFQDPDGEVQVPMVLDLDVTAWGVYARAAKTRGISIERMISHVLRSVDLGFQEDGYTFDYERSREERDKRNQVAEGGAK